MKAKAICGVCPVQDPCSSHAIDIREPFGIWGGLTEVERRSIAVAG
jgi:WhiB family redox-sensing transcriptional regulator